MRVWIDLANSPHVLFFAPLIPELERRGATTLLTARDFSQTLGLAKLHGLATDIIGSHGGQSTYGKVKAILNRSIALRGQGRKYEPDLAVSHNSYAHCLAAKSLRIPYVTIMDFEHTPANHVNFRFADRILLPACIPLNSIRKYGARKGKAFSYKGFKEQVYLDDFIPDRSVLDPVLPQQLWEDFVIIVARPPADFAIYHRFQNPLFETWLRKEGRNPTVRIVLLPRTQGQREHVESLALPSLILPDRPLDGPNLIHHADLVLSAGGTMNREAAVLGVPAFSMFVGPTAAVDQELEQLGRLVFVRREEDLGKIMLEKKATTKPLRNPGLRAQLVDLIMDLVIDRPRDQPL